VQRKGDKTAAISGGTVEGKVRWQIILWASSMSKDMSAALEIQVRSLGALTLTQSRCK
jgi:hypothetical protein